MLSEFRKRRDELVAQVEQMDRASRATSDEKERERIVAKSWELVARVWLYRSTGPLEHFQHVGQIRSYLDYLEREIGKDVKRDPRNKNERARLDEVRFARRLLGGSEEIPLF